MRDHTENTTDDTGVFGRCSHCGNDAALNWGHCRECAAVAKERAAEQDARHAARRAAEKAEFEALEPCRSNDRRKLDDGEGYTISVAEAIALWARHPDVPRYLADGTGIRIGPHTGPLLFVRR